MGRVAGHSDGYQGRDSHWLACRLCVIRLHAEGVSYGSTQRAGSTRSVLVAAWNAASAESPSDGVRGICSSQCQRHCAAIVAAKATCSQHVVGLSLFQLRRNLKRSMIKLGPLAVSTPHSMEILVLRSNEGPAFVRRQHQCCYDSFFLEAKQ